MIFFQLFFYDIMKSIPTEIIKVKFKDRLYFIDNYDNDLNDFILPDGWIWFEKGLIWSLKGWILFGN